MKNKASIANEVSNDSLRTSKVRLVNLAIKRVVDVLGAGLLILLSAPLIGVAALLVRLTSKGPAFYSQRRMGLFGEIFTIYKLRSMVVDSEARTGAAWASPDDPRITVVGKFLRLSHIDELPQLWNVIKGDMSLIGPRPERPEFLQELEEAFPEYQARLQVRPGITGLAQVQFSADTDLSSVGRKLAYDCYYVKRLSIWLDARIAACTGLYLFLEVPLRIARELLLLLDKELLERDLQVAMEQARSATQTK